MRSIGACLTVLLLTVGAMARAEEIGPVTLYYSLRPSLITLEPDGQVFKDAGLTQGALRVLFFADLPQKDYRYIVCGQHTDPRVMERINKAIHELSMP